MASRDESAGVRLRAALACALCLTFLIGSAVLFIPRAKAANVTIHLYGRFSAPVGWSLTAGAETDPGPDLTVDQGDHVTMQLTGEDGSAHIFWIDYNGNGAVDADEPASAQFFTTTSFSFDAVRAGTFTYWCAIHKPSMRGTWVTTDTEAPVVSAVVANPAAQVPGGAVNLTAQATDNIGVTGVVAHIVGPSSFDANLTMTRLSSSSFYLSRTFADAGTYTVTVWARDAAGHLGSRQGSFTIGAPPAAGQDSAYLIALAAFAAAAVVIGGIILQRRRRTRKP